MSNIYEALNKSGEASAFCVVESIGAKGPQVSETAPPTSGSNGFAKERISAPEAAADPVPQSYPALSQGYRVVPARITPGTPVFPFDGNQPQAAEQYRILRTNLLQHPVKPTLIAVSSACCGDGKTITAVNLAGILALRSEVAVLLIDADLRRSAIASTLGIQPTPGFAEVLSGQCLLKDAIVRVEQIPNLHVLPAGQVASNPAELLDSMLCSTVIADMRKAFSFVIFDTAPVAVVADFNLIKVRCDGTVLVVRSDHTDRSAFFETVRANKDRLLGVIVNAVDPWFLWKAGRADYHNYYQLK